MTDWTTYKLFTDRHGECCGCGKCGYVAYLSKRPAHSTFKVDLDGTVVSTVFKDDGGRGR